MTVAVGSHFSDNFFATNLSLFFVPLIHPQFTQGCVFNVHCPTAYPVRDPDKTRTVTITHFSKLHLMNVVGTYQNSFIEAIQRRTQGYLKKEMIIKKHKNCLIKLAYL